MKKIMIALLCLFIAVTAASCGQSAQTEEAPRETEQVTETEEQTEETEETEETKSTKPKVKIGHQAVKIDADSAAATEKPEKPEKQKPTEETTESSEPPTQGVTRANTHINVYVEKGKFEANDLIFDYAGAYIELNDLIEDATAILGEEDAVDEFSKTRTEYDFGDITLVTYKAGGEERVEQISINSEDISTSKNAVIGMYATQLRRIYGDPTRATASAYVYTLGSKSLIFYHEENIVNEIKYKLSR